MSAKERPSRPLDIKQLEREFKDPGAEFRTVPFWGLNDNLEEGELRRQIREMKEKGLGGFFMHSRLGLITPYLSQEWMKSLMACVDEAGRRGMHAWLYDEDRWPSGFAGGLVPAKGEEYRQKFLQWREIRDLSGMVEAVEEPGFIRLFLCDTKDGKVIGFKDITDSGPGETDLQEKVGLCFYIKYAEPLVRFNNFSWVDELNPDAVGYFIASTYDPYYREFGSFFGGTIPGIFTDEPNFGMDYARMTAGISRDECVEWLPWTWALPEYFRNRNGYDLLSLLPLLIYEQGDYMKVRADFWETVLARFIEAFTRPIYEWCKGHGLEFTGHYLWEDTLGRQTGTVGSTMPHYEYMDIPGIDHLWRNIDDLITVKQVTSVAHQLGKKRVLSETYGGSGWNLSFREQKWIGDWQYALGINFMNQHLALYSLKGSRKRDFPPSLYYQQPWWPYYKHVADYFARLSYMLSQGDLKADILLLHPMTSAWSVYHPRNRRSVDRLNGSFTALAEILSGLQRDYDFGDEILIEKYGRVVNGKFAIGQASYQVVILPPAVTWKGATLRLLKEFTGSGGKVIPVEPLPDLKESEEYADLLADLFAGDVPWVGLDQHSIKAALDKVLTPDVLVVDDQGEPVKDLYCQHRVVDGRHILFFANADPQHKHQVNIHMGFQGLVQKWDPESGNISEMPCDLGEDGLSCRHDFLPAGSLLILIDESRAPAIKKASKQTLVDVAALDCEWRIHAQDFNALTLDYCQYKIGDGDWSRLEPVWRAQQAAEAAGDGVRVALRFQFRSALELPANKQVFLAMEEPEGFKIAINGQTIKPRDQGWWIDISFRKLNIAPFVATGENVLELECDFKYPAQLGTMVFQRGGVELESVYVAGEFAVKQDSQGFYLANSVDGAATGDWCAQGFPFYAGTLTYEQEFTFQKPDDLHDRIYLAMDAVHAQVVNVLLNGENLSTLFWEPYRVEITEALRNGLNRLEIQVTNSLRNLLGPHHHKEGELTVVRPGSFTDPDNWTDDYHFVPCGLLGRVVIETYRIDKR